MELGIIGFPRAGKTTVFNALTRGKAETAAYALGTLKPNVGMAKVPDPRLEALAGLLHPQRLVPAEARYVDIPVAESATRGLGIGGELLNQLQRSDALVHVARAFENPAVPHPRDGVDLERDIADMEMELAFVDLGILERRLARLEATLKGAKPQERAAVAKEQELLGRVKAALEAERPILEQGHSAETIKALESYQFLTTKPLLTVANIGEGQIPQAEALERRLRESSGRPWKRFVALCGKLEEELGQMSEAEEQEFRQSLGVGQSGRERVLRASFDVLGLATFFTVVSNEVRAWTVPKDTPAVKAAGKIHSDMERGFIRAEVVPFADLMACGSLAEARKRGLLRLEGKGYPVKDGDVITFLFNV